jgi:hypothetical protein
VRIGGRRAEFILEELEIPRPYIDAWQNTAWRIERPGCVRAAPAERPRATDPRTTTAEISVAERSETCREDLETLNTRTADL